MLVEYGDNIDAAIKHLTSLRLSTASSSTGTPEQQAAAAAGATDQQQQRQQQQAEPATEASEGPSGAGRSAEEWVALVVHEMAAAKDMADARARASKVLQAFEHAALQHAKQQGSGAEAERLRLQLAEAQREGQLLKRAVAIQNLRMQELR